MLGVCMMCKLAEGGMCVCVCCCAVAAVGVVHLLSVPGVHT